MYYNLKIWYFLAEMEYMKYENIWITKPIYEDAEIKYYENLAKVCVSVKDEKGN